MPYNIDTIPFKQLLYNELTTKKLVSAHLMANALTLMTNSRNEVNPNHAIPLKHQEALAMQTMANNYQYLETWFNNFHVKESDRKKVYATMHEMERISLQSMVIDNQYRKDPIKTEKLSQVDHDVNILMGHQIDSKLINKLDNTWITAYAAMVCKVESKMENMLTTYV